MNTKLGTIREFETRDWRVEVFAVEDWDTDLSWDEDGTVREGLESGRFISFTAIVEVTHKPTGVVMGGDSLGGCIYESLEAFEDHRACALENRKRLAAEGRFKVYRKARPYKSILSAGDVLAQGFATRDDAESWAREFAAEDWQVFETGKCGSYFADMVYSAIQAARENVAAYKGINLRAA